MFSRCLMRDRGLKEERKIEEKKKKGKGRKKTYRVDKNASWPSSVGMVPDSLLKNRDLWVICH